MSGTNVAALVADLAHAVELTMSTDVSQNERLKAYNACESFKETSPLCAEAGLYLAAGTQYSLISRHFGLQLMEHTVKYRWTQITQQEKLFIKENAMKLLAAGGIADESHMKDALSRVIVEMVKREWPQQWPGLLNELSDACTCGEIQTELVLLVFLRLVEDVALLQTLESNQRRKDIYHALTANMSIIFEFFLNLIDIHIEQFHTLTDANNLSKAANHGRVVQVVLLTLTGFVEWVAMTHIMAQNGRLLQRLCVLLNNTTFQLAATECLSQIVNRKGKIDDRKPLLILFNDEAIHCILNASKDPGQMHDEQNYLFKKKLIQVLGGLATQLNLLWGKDNLNRPVNFSAYLESILAFSNHPSLTLAHMANPLWNTMLKHELISKDPIFLSYIPRWITCTAPKIIKFQFQSKFNESIYARMDFDNEDEFLTFFYRSRSDFLDSFRQATLVAPLVTFDYCEQWLMKCLQIPPTTIVTAIQTDIYYQEWEALSTCLESILNRLLQANERPNISSGLHLLQLCLNYRPIDPSILSTLLTCISALFVFLSMSTGQMAPTSTGAALLPQVLEKIFATLMYTLSEGETKETRSRAVKNVRRHAASLMVKIGNKYPLLLLPLFEQIKATVETLSRTEGTTSLSTLEKVTLQESLLLISNHFADYERQTNFVGELFTTINLQWNRDIFKNITAFINYIGLNAIDNHDKGTNRSNLVYCINLLLGGVKRCSWPDDPERAQRGGFLIGYTETGNPYYRNPVTPHLLPYLGDILALLKFFNELFTPDVQSMIIECYRGCLRMSDTERANLLGITTAGHGWFLLTNENDMTLLNTMEAGTANTTTNHIERMQRFLIGLHESCYHMIGSIGPSLGRDFYSFPNLAIAINHSVLYGLEYVPDYRLRPIIRVFLKSFIHSCPPPYYESLLLNVIDHIAPIMFNRLHTKWLLINEMRQREAQDDNNTDAQEVLEDILTRALTREYLDVLKIALVGGGFTPDTNQDIMETEDLGIDSSPISSTTTSTTSNRNAITLEIISDFGLLLLRNDKLRQCIVLTILGALSWIDSNASLKATALVGPLVRQLLSDCLMDREMAARVMASVLNALTLHGQHEANQGSLLTLGVQMYEILRPNYEEARAVMQQIPGVNPVDLQKLDERIAGSTSKGNKIEKVKKDLFRKITGNLIGRSVGQLFKKEVKIHDLPRMPINNKKIEDNSITNLQNLFS